MNLPRLILILTLFTLCAPASAQVPAGWPAKPISLYLPYTPGALDVSLRAYMSAITPKTGWNFVIEYKPGASGSIAAGLVHKAPADGHSLFVSSRNIVMGEIMEAKLPYDGLKDFTPVYQLTNTTQVVVVHPSFPVRDMREYIAYAKANPGKVNWGMIGNAGVQRLSGEMLHQLAGVKVTFVPYKGASPIITDVIAGRIQVTMQSERSAGAPAKAGKLRVIATSLANGRSEAFPGITSVAEQGVPDFSYSAWTALHARTGTPEPIVRALNVEFNRAAKSPELIAKFKSIGETVGGGTVEEFKAFQLTEQKRWVGIAKDLGIKLSGN